MAEFVEIRHNMYQKVKYIRKKQDELFAAYHPTYKLKRLKFVARRTTLVK